MTNVTPGGAISVWEAILDGATQAFWFTQLSVVAIAALLIRDVMWAARPSGVAGGTQGFTEKARRCTES